MKWEVWWGMFCQGRLAEHRQAILSCRFKAGVSNWETTFFCSSLNAWTWAYYQYCNFDTWIRSHLRAKLCEWAVGSAMAGWYSRAKVLKWFRDPVYQRPILLLTEKGVNISIWSCCCCDAINFFPSLHPFCHEMNITVSPKLTMS